MDRIKRITSAIDIGGFEVVESSLRQCDEDDAVKVILGNTILHTATQKQVQDPNSDSFVKTFVLPAQYVDGNIRNNLGELAVDVILRSEDKKLEHVLVVLLAQEGVEESCNEDIRLFVPAVTWSRWSIIEMFLNKDMDLNRERRLKLSALSAINKSQNCSFR